MPINDIRAKSLTRIVWTLYLKSIFTLGIHSPQFCGDVHSRWRESSAFAGVSSTVRTPVNVGGAHVLAGGPNLAGFSIGKTKSVTKSDLAKMLSMPFPKPKTGKDRDQANALSPWRLGRCSFRSAVRNAEVVGSNHAISTKITEAKKICT